MFPQDLLQLLVIVGAVVPGFVYQISRRRIRGPGPDEQSVTIRVLRSIATSVVFVCVYIAVLGYPPLGVELNPDGLPVSWRPVAIGTLMLALVIPWFAARAIYYLMTAPPIAGATSAITRHLSLRSQWDPTPSAWDFAFNGRKAGWVRVQTSDGTWMGGWFGDGSFASSFPEPREIFIEQGYVMDGAGVFTGDISAPNGLYIRCDDIRLLDFTTDPESSEPAAEAVGADSAADDGDNESNGQEMP